MGISMEINEKIEIFFEAAIATANKQSEEILEEQKKTYQETLKKYEKSKLAGQNTRIRIAEAKVVKDVNRTVSEQAVLLKKEYHDCAKEKKEELFSIVEKKLADYQKTEDYRKLLAEMINKAKKFANGAAMTIYINPTDSEIKEALEQECGCELTISKEDFMGGIRAVIREKNVLIEESFANRVKQEKETYSF